MLRLFSLLLLVLVGIGCRWDASAQTERPVPIPETNFYEITTPMGRLVIRLYDETPLHRDNFKTLVEEQYYDSTRFHRVIAGFMIQGGDPNSRDADPLNDGTGGPPYTLPAEIGKPHVRGALAAARTADFANPERRSSGSQFYIVAGTPVDSLLLLQMREAVRQSLNDPAFDWPEEVAARYRAQGGTPFLDGQYTVFGELVEGFDVLDAISNVETGRARGEQSPVMDQPPMPVWMTVRPLHDYSPPADSTR